MDVDAVVAGAGAAGLSAAIAAAQRGRSVLLLERSETFRDGCCTSMSTAMIPAALGARLAGRGSQLVTLARRI